MKAKPVIPSSMEGVRAINRAEAETFLQSGKADLKENPAPSVNPPPAPKPSKEVPTAQVPPPADTTPVHRGKKLVELPLPLLEKIKDTAHHLSKQSGRRVTETQLIETALEQYFKQL